MAEAIRNSFRRSPPGFITIEQDDHMREMFADDFFLCIAHSGTHECDTREPSLRYFHAIEESFDKNDGEFVSHPMHVKQFERLVEARRKFVARFRSVDRSSGIRNEFALRVMNRDHDAIMHRSLAWEKSHTKFLRSLNTYSPLFEMRM